MSRTKIITIVCWAISVVALLGLVVWFFVSQVSNFNFNSFEVGRFELAGTYTVTSEEVESISIDWISGAVEVRGHHGNEIIISEYARRNLSNNEVLVYRVDNGVLTIRFTERNSWNINLTKQLYVLVPYSLIVDLDVLNIETVSGRIDVSNVSANSVRVNTTSGRINLSHLQASTISASTTSGRIELSNIEVEELHLRTVSGRIEVTQTTAYSLNANTTSGRQEYSGSFNYINIRSTSGRLTIVSQIVPDSITAHATSGRIELRIPLGEPISVHYSTGSGRFRSDIPVITGGVDPQFRLSTSSGRIHIYSLR